MNITGFFYIKLKRFTLNTTFNIHINKITAIIGEAGSGKTTFLKCISGLLKPSFGYLKINKKTLYDSRNNIFINSNERCVGHVLQNPYLFTHLSVLNNIKCGVIETNKCYITFSNIITYLNLNKLTNRTIENISGGERQRIIIAQIMLTQPKIILLDESFSSQDINMKKKLMIFFKNINREYKIPIIYVSHNIYNIKKFVDSIIFFKNGKIVNM